MEVSLNQPCTVLVGERGEEEGRRAYEDMEIGRKERRVKGVKEVEEVEEVEERWEGLQ